MPDIIRHQAAPGRRSWAGYMRILRDIYDGIDTAQALAEANLLNVKTMREVLRRMLALNLVHIRNVVIGANRLRMPVWGLGSSPMAIELPAYFEPLQPNRELIAMASMLEAMRQQPHSIRTLAETCGLNRDRVGQFIRECHEVLHVVHVTAWEPRLRRAGNRAAMYSLCFGSADLPRPAVIPMAEVRARYEAKRTARKRERRRLIALAPHASVFTWARAA